MDAITLAIEETEDAIKKSTNVTIHALAKKWAKIFPSDLVESNIRLLKDHAQTFFNEILSETDRKEEIVMERIESLRKEKSQLERLLQVEKHIDLSNLPLLVYQQELDTSLEDLRQELQGRKIEIKDLLLKQEEFCNILDEPKMKLYEDPLSSAEDIEIFKEHLKYLDSLLLERRNTVTELKADICGLSEQLEIPIIEEPYSSLLRNSRIILSKYNIEILVQLATNLQQQKLELTEAIENIKRKLETLWDCLEVDKSTQKKFSALTGCSQGTYDKLKAELTRCEAEKRRHVKVFVDRIRQDILEMWNLLLKSDDEREQFGAFTSELYNEDLLRLHELEYESLKDEYEKNKKIFECFDKHQKLFERMQALETTNPDRLQNRGGQLLKEEQERKKISKNLPAIREEITNLATVYEKRNHRPFLVNGSNIVDVINDMYKIREERKQTIASNRKLNATAVQRTPMSVKDKKQLPVGSRNANVAAVRTPTMANKSQLKRMASATLLSNSTKKYRTHLEVPQKPVVRAQRGLFKDSQPKSQIPTFVQPTETVAKKKKKTTIIKAVVSSLVNRRQSTRVKKRKSKNSSKNSSISQSKKKIPSAESSVLDYGDFQHIVSARKKCRSSEVGEYRSPLKMRNDNKTTRALRPPTPSQSNRTVSPRAGCTSKLSTKNLPILF
ncbi:Protein regulator of cytokinesis 1 [Pseudolycoriella hygida]|uniref:Protein regulator of cytokinesis 1 n=1 Tax=Pseudolycoriella hygida TaxID=35572 RepID=A0A9Q0MUL2_9DIPT|nr:Protein regulator of cytokinesis 1 [Pseudolycoriella hygida]